MRGIRAQQLQWLDIHAMICAVARLPLEDRQTDSYASRIRQYLSGDVKLTYANGSDRGMFMSAHDA